MSYDSVKMGEYLASYASRKGYYINHTKLQKLLYILYGAYLTIHNEALLNEQPKAWPYGPVFPRVQKKFAKNTKFTDADIDSPEYQNMRENASLNTLIDDVLNTFGNWTAQALSEWSHASGSPWARALANNNMTFNAVLAPEDIKEYFKTFMNV